MQKAGYRRGILVGLLLTPFLVGADPIAHWHLRSSGIGQNLAGVAYGSGRFVAVGQAGRLLVSSNGADWSTNHQQFTTQHLHSVAYAAGQFLTVGDGGALFASTDGANWIARDSTTTNGLRAVRWVNGRFFAAGEKGTLLSSADGLSWTSHDSGSPHTLVGVAYGNATYVAIGQGNTHVASVAVAEDGVTWTNQLMDLNGLYDLAFGGGRFVALGIRGRVHVSTNGRQWTTHGTGDGRYLFATTYLHGRFLAAGGPFGGGSQKIVASADGQTWDTHPVAINHSGTLRAIAYGEATFVAVGDKGIILQSDSFFRLARGAGWPLGAREWIFATDPGRAYRFQCSDQLPGTTWVDLTNFTGTGEVFTLSDPSAATAEQRFYRLISP